MSEARVHLELSVEQAQAVAKALDLYTRICLGQFNMIEELVREGTVPMYSGTQEERKLAGAMECEAIEDVMNNTKAILGFSRGGGFGIGNHHVDITGHRTYEVLKSLQKPLAEYRKPNPDYRGVHYDGLTVRYTQDPEPTVSVSEPNE